MIPPFGAAQDRALAALNTMMAEEVLERLAISAHFISSPSHLIAISSPRRLVVR
jgi:hypothetical protein